MYADAVFEGGGVKAIGILGALSEAERRGYNWVNVAGTSAGAIIASLVAAGYAAEEIKNLLYEIDLNLFKDKDWLFQIPFFGPALRLWFKSGLYEGNYMEQWLRSKLAAKGVSTFKDLILTGFENDPQFRYKLVVIATDVSRRKLLKLPQDMKDYNMDPDDLEVCRAVRMSSCLPFFYQPCKLSYTDSNHRKQTSYIIDGGVLSNFPVWIFDSETVPPWPTLGFRITEPEETAPLQVKNPFTLFKAIVSTMLEAHDKLHELDMKSNIRAISIPSVGVKTIDFDISERQKDKLYQSGVQACIRFFEGWSFENYKLHYYS
ncbi:MAG: patatin-like phospholipase family protein [Desulfotomaculaceae bacterium]|nr:patatin-like phospholipase family protein [Desulfotomaculaceae bacterium]